MAEPDALRAWWGSEPVGTLYRDAQGRMGFRYDERWLRDRNEAVSVSLPPRPEPFEPDTLRAHRFFANLLPEGAARASIVRQLRVADTDFDLLRAIGDECAGALSILAEGRVPSNDASYRELDGAAFERLVRTRGLLPGEGVREVRRPRLSLAGAQDKCALHRAGDVWLEPLGGAPSTHILKFESPGFANVLVYEAFLTALARRVGLPVVDVELGRVASGARFLSVRRYDRAPLGGAAVERLHQEDFCQALGIGHERKYEADGGPTFSDCLELVRSRSVDPIVDAEHLLAWQVFNAVAGNSDGHAKNLSLLYAPDAGARLAPFYDLVCTRAIVRVDTRLAFSIGGQRRPADLEGRHWRAFADACDVGHRFVLDLVRRTLEATVEAVAPVRAEFEGRHGPMPALQRVERVIATQSKRLGRALG